MLIEDASASTVETTSEDPSPAPTKFVARQPILDLHRTVIGYELLFRSGWENAFRGESCDATRQMLDNCLWMDIDSLTGHTLAFINCTREALVGKLVTLCRLQPRCWKSWRQLNPTRIDCCLRRTQGDGLPPGAGRFSASARNAATHRHRHVYQG